MLLMHVRKMRLGPLQLYQFVALSRFFKLCGFTWLEKRQLVRDVQVRSVLRKLPVLFVHQNFIGFLLLLFVHWMSFCLFRNWQVCNAAECWVLQRNDSFCLVFDWLVQTTFANSSLSLFAIDPLYRLNVLELHYYVQASTILLFDWSFKATRPWSFAVGWRKLNALELTALLQLLLKPTGYRWYGLNGSCSSFLSYLGSKLSKLLLNDSLEVHEGAKRHLCGLFSFD